MIKNDADKLSRSLVQKQIFEKKFREWLGGGVIGTLAVFDISESGRQIGEKLFTFLNPKQKRELEKYVNEQEKHNGGLFQDDSYLHTESQIQESKCPLTEIW